MKILSNIRTLLALAFKHPKSIVNVLSRETMKPFYIIRYGVQRGREQYYLTKLASFLQCDKQEILRYFEEIDEEFIDYLRSQTKTVTSQSYQEWREIYGRYIYVIVRILRPGIVVETGVAAGISSAYILKALHRNGRGILFSIELSIPLQPTRDLWIPEGREIGYAIPENLKTRWKLILGDSKEKLPELLNALNTLDLFLHDSLHTYEHMTFEYKTAWKVLRKNGILLSDDVNLNKAFIDFCKRNNAGYMIIGNRLGIIRKG